MERKTERSTDFRENNPNRVTTIPLEDGNGVYYISANINDVLMKFIFDTGASSISISETEAAFLYKQGTLTKEDFQGMVNFQDAKGEVTQGMVVKLRKVEVGGFVLKNVDASIVPNQNAPLLLGQSVLQKFGKLSIDNRNKQLIIEK
jgi:aspartyl protease family protein